MSSTSGGLINLLIVWGIASATGFVAMAALMLVGDWSMMQALFAAAVVFLGMGIVLSVFAGVLVAFLLRSSVLGVRPVMRAISARGLTPLPTDIQFVASSDIRISSESLSSPAMT